MPVCAPPSLTFFLWYHPALAEAVSDTASEADDVTTFDPEISEKVDMAKAVAADLKAVR